MRRGWTLIEVVTVVAILSMLMVVLLPTLAQTQRQSMHLQCDAHLRQLARAATLHTIERAGMFPPGLLYGTDHDATSGDVRCWDWWRRPDGGLRPGPLWQYTDVTDPSQVLRCPLVETTDPTWAGDPVTGYNYNVAFVAAESGSVSGAAPGMGAWDLVTPKANLDGLGWLTRSQCRRAGDTALFGMGGRLGGVNKFMRSPVNTGGYDVAYGGGQAFLDGRTHVGWIDGHVSSRRHPFQGQHWDDLPDWLTSNLDWPRNGFLSSNARAYDPR